MEHHNSILPAPKRTPWNKGKLIGAKPPLLARHVWSIRTRLQIQGRVERAIRWGSRERPPWRRRRIHVRPARSIFSKALNFCRSAIAVLVRSP
jgi:hypothetical protein